jgi:hypothetical protein
MPPNELDELVDGGIAAAERALQISPRDSKSARFLNAFLRLRAALTSDPGARETLTARAARVGRYPFLALFDFSPFAGGAGAGGGGSSKLTSADRNVGDRRVPHRHLHRLVAEQLRDGAQGGAAHYQPGCERGGAA